MTRLSIICGEAHEISYKKLGYRQTEKQTDTKMYVK